MRFEYYADRDKVVDGLGAAFLFLVAFSIFCLTRGADARLKGIPAHPLGWAGLVVLGVILLSAPWPHIFHTGPHLIIDEKGIDDRAGGLGLIPWEEILSLEIRSVTYFAAQSLLCLRLRDPSHFMQRIWWLKRLCLASYVLLGYPMSVINFGVLEPGLDKAKDQIQEIVQSRISAGLYVPSQVGWT